MLELLVVILIPLSMVAAMWLAYRRMIGIRDGTQSRLEVDPDPLPPIISYEEVTVGEGGLAHGKAMTFDSHLGSADRRGAEMPDINQTLQGKR